MKAELLSTNSVVPLDNEFSTVKQKMLSLFFVARPVCSLSNLCYKFLYLPSLLSSAKNLSSGEGLTSSYLYAIVFTERLQVICWREEEENLFRLLIIEKFHVMHCVRKMHTVL